MRSKYVLTMESTLRYTVIKNLDQYNAYCNEHEAMMAEDEERYRDEIDLLELLIEDYDQRAVAANQSSTLDPVE